MGVNLWSHIPATTFPCTKATPVWQQSLLWYTTVDGEGDSDGDPWSSPGCEEGREGGGGGIQNDSIAPG